MQLAPIRSATAHQFDMTPLRVGSMLLKDGTSTKIPWLPDMKVTRGEAWVVESTPQTLRLRERNTLWNGVPATWDQTLHIESDGVVDFAVRGTMLGAPLPTLHQRFDMLDAGRGWFELRSVGKPGERPSTMRVEGNSFVVDFVGPLGTHDSKTVPIIQPGEAGYRQPPAGWLN